MAVTDEFLRAWTAEHGRWLLHVCRSFELRDQVLCDGLIPGAAPHYIGPLACRPGHVYLTTPQSADMIGAQVFTCACEDAPWVAVDIRGLDPNRINPDEDCFYESWIVDEPVDLRGLPAAEGLVRDDDGLVRAERATMDWAAFSARPYGSYGEWAAAVDLGSDPAMTEDAWTRVGSLAYHGTIASHLLRPAHVTADGRVTVMSAAPAQ
jgi:hypothetical protein